MFTTNLAMTQFSACFHEAFLAQFGHQQSNAELNIVEQQTFMNPTIRGNCNHVRGI